MQNILLDKLIEQVSCYMSGQQVQEVTFESEIEGNHYYLVCYSSPSSSSSVRLSPREKAISQLVAQGLPNKLIAKELEISHHTVATYLRRIFQKLEVSTRAEMIARLSKANLLV